MNDPIVDEVHRAREKLWNQCGRNWQQLLRYLRERERAHPERLAKLPPAGGAQETNYSPPNQSAS